MKTTKTKRQRKSKYLLMHDLSEAFVRMVRQQERRLGVVISYNFQVKK